MLCEMCGEEVPLTSRVRVEGSVLRVCPACSKFGTPIDPPVASRNVGPSATGHVPELEGTPITQHVVARTRRLEERDLFQDLPDMELASDWFKRIRIAREKLTWTPEELGKRLNEKKSVVLKIETGAFRPPDEMIRKIERLLKIRLRADAEPAA
ncbi:MAG: multiprotein-bridging factor 1 family protein [Thermoplasmata archaeon]